MQLPHVSAKPQNGALCEAVPPHATQEATAMRARALLLSFFVCACTPTFAQAPLPDSQGGRFSFHQVAEGLLRLDSRTGQVSFCRGAAAGWACHAVPDEREALEIEIARLQSDNARLKREIIARGHPLPRGIAPEDSKPAPQAELKLPSDAEVERVMAFFEKIWRRLVEMVQSMQKDVDRKG
jgi:hypothetical protein